MFIHPQVHHIKTRNSPSRNRRRARRAAARLKEAEETSNHCKVAEEATENQSEVQILNESVVDIAAKAIDGSEEAPTETVVAEKASEGTETVVDDEFSCDFCNSAFASLRGLKTHEGKMHKVVGSPIPQLDGESKCDVVYTFVSDYHKEDIEYTLEEIFPREIEVNFEYGDKVGGNWTADRLCKVTISGHKIYSWPDMTRSQAVVFKDITMQ